MNERSEVRRRQEACDPSSERIYVIVTYEMVYRWLIGVFVFATN